jgi:hypothetical protein
LTELAKPAGEAAIRACVREDVADWIVQIAPLLRTPAGPDLSAPRNGILQGGRH